MKNKKEKKTKEKAKNIKQRKKQTTKKEYQVTICCN